MKFSKTIPLVFSLFILVTVACSQKKSSTDQLSANDFQTKLAASIDGQLLDVRTPQEYGDGHLKNAKNINFNDDAFATKVEKLDKSKPVFVYCLSGKRSADAAEQMRKSGFKQVYELEGGILAWRAASLPEDRPMDNLTISSGPGGITQGMSDEDFKKTVTDDVLVMVDFTATWCGPCKKLAPILDELIEENKGKIKLVKIDIDQNRTLATTMNITAIPVVQIYKGGNKVWEQLGLCTKETVAAAIKSNQ
ncbi:MAG: thioredoxin domain-containing protein [Bacteroidia bacterium]